MNKRSQKRIKQANLSKVICRALLVIPAMFVADVALAIPEIQPEKWLSQASPSLNTPSEVKPQQPTEQPLPRISPVPPKTEDVIQPPLPESQQPPSAMVTPVEGKVNVKLVNATKAVINYQVIGDTNQRALGGDSDVTLRNIKTPVTVTFRREDKGLLQVNPKAVSSGLLEVFLDETTSLDEDKNTLVVQQSGAVFTN